MNTEEALLGSILLGRSNGFDEAHSLQDARLAVRLFDLLPASRELADARDLLYAAAILHDIGYSEGYGRHHKTAYRLIMEASLPGLTDREKQIVANIARYHRGARPVEMHRGFASLSAEDRHVVALLGAILRLADGLDRSHSGAVTEVDLFSEDDRLVVRVVCPLGCDAEAQAAEKKGRWLGDVLGVRVEVRVLPAAEER